MSRIRLRLIASLTLVAYIATSAHASMGLCKAAPVRSEHATPPAPEPRAKNDRRKPHCKHCEARRAAERARQAQHAKPGKPQQPCDDSCPDCPKGPGKPCHYPGGCGFCNAAKVPCLVVLTPAQDTTLLIGAALVDVPAPYTSPCRGGLIRPPRV
ncbi:MAG: hypothetical protein U0793_05450 [Gemmataceae bacterium]